MEGKITYDDIEKYSHLFTLVPAFVLERMARKNANLVSKFESATRKTLNDLTDEERKKLHLILAANIDDLQSLMRYAYKKSGKKHYKILGNPEYKPFVKLNLNEIKKMI